MRNRTLWQWSTVYPNYYRHLRILLRKWNLRRKASQALIGKKSQESTSRISGEQSESQEKSILRRINVKAAFSDRWLAAWHHATQNFEFSKILKHWNLENYDFTGTGTSIFSKNVCHPSPSPVPGIIIQVARRTEPPDPGARAWLYPIKAIMGPSREVYDPSRSTPVL